MTSVVSVLLVEPDERLVRERAEQLLMDGYAVDGVSAVEGRGSSSPRGRTRSCWERAGDDRPVARAAGRGDPARRLEAAGACGRRR